MTETPPPARFAVEQKDLTAFVACLAIGTLHQIRRDHIPPQTGIWSLAVPAFVGPLEEAGLPEELTAVLRACDELSALQRYLPDEFFRFTDELIERLEAVLRAVKDPIYRLHWLDRKAAPEAAVEGSSEGSSEESTEALASEPAAAPAGEPAEGPPGETAGPASGAEPTSAAEVPRMGFDQMARAMESPDLTQIEEKLREELSAQGQEPGEDLGEAARKLQRPSDAPPLALETAIANWVLGRR